MLIFQANFRQISIFFLFKKNLHCASKMSKILLHTYRLNSIENVPKLLLSVEKSSPPLAKKQTHKMNLVRNRNPSCLICRPVIIIVSVEKKISSNRRAENLHIRFRESAYPVPVVVRRRQPSLPTVVEFRKAGLSGSRILLLRQIEQIYIDLHIDLQNHK